MTEAAPAAESPILVLGSGQRCGSTLVQRLLTSHPGIMIWGEHGGHLRDFIAMVDVLGKWDQWMAPEARQEFEAGGHDAWIANLLPGPEALHEAARRYLLTLFADPAAERGRPRWGFKEVRFGFEDADALRRLFPRLVVVHVTRDPRAVLVSLEAWERAGEWWPREYTERAIATWVDVTASFLEAGDRPWVLSRRYEDVVADPARFTAELAALIGTEPQHFDSAVFDRRISGYNRAGERRLRSWNDLPNDLRRLLKTPRLREVADAAGYV